LTSEIIQTDHLTEAQEEELFGWGDDIFGADDLNLHWRPKDLHFLLQVSGATVSHVGVLTHEVSVADKPIRVGGVGAVVTPPAWQKRGYARALMQHTARFLATTQVDAGLLFCLRRRVAFYESQGWRLVNHPVLIQQPSGEIVAPLEVMVLHIGERRWPEGEVKLNSFPW
jgi:GNAT superfamily N-acetyltransferase